MVKKVVEQKINNRPSAAQHKAQTLQRGSIDLRVLFKFDHPLQKYA